MNQPSDSRSIVTQLRHDLDKMAPQFAMALPVHIPAERFIRVVMTAIQNNPSLLKCTRQSLFNACMKAAQDGLLPDGREGAIVAYGENTDGRRSAENASWMPMVQGLRKKARNSGEIADWQVHLVHVGDIFEYQLGDSPHIFHKPLLNGGRERQILAVYSVATFKDGTKSREVMTIKEVEDVRDRYSKAKKGPWSDPIAFPEMVRKTCARLHSKQLPMSSDLDDLIRRDDELYDMKGARDQDKEAKDKRPHSVAAAFDQFAGAEETIGEVIDNETGEVVGGDSPASQPEAPKQGPRDAQEYAGFVRSVLTGASDADVLDNWWRADEQQRLRGHCKLTIPQFDALDAEVKQRSTELRNREEK